MNRHPNSASHLADCAACRAEIAADDPSRLFALLALEPLPEALLDRVSDGVAEAIDAEPRHARGGQWGALAASLALAGLLGAYLSGQGAALDTAPTAAILDYEPARFAARVDLLSSPGSAQVLDLSVGETKLVMIFDEAMDL